MCLLAFMFPDLRRELLLGLKIMALAVGIFSTIENSILRNAFLACLPNMGLAIFDHHSEMDTVECVLGVISGYYMDYA